MTQLGPRDFIYVKKKNPQSTLENTIISYSPKLQYLQWTLPKVMVERDNRHSQDLMAE